VHKIGLDQSSPCFWELEDVRVVDLVRGAFEQEDLSVSEDDCAYDNLIICEAFFRTDSLLKMEARHVEDGD